MEETAREGQQPQQHARRLPLPLPGREPLLRWRMGRISHERASERAKRARRAEQAAPAEGREAARQQRACCRRPGAEWLECRSRQTSAPSSGCSAQGCARRRDSAGGAGALCTGTGTSPGATIRLLGGQAGRQAGEREAGQDKDRKERLLAKTACAMRSCRQAGRPEEIHLLEFPLCIHLHHAT